MKQSKLDIIKQKGSGFKVPKGYLDAVEDAVISELKTETFPDKDGFITPKGYFDSFEDNLFNKLGKEFIKTESFDIPKDYFDTLEDRVFDRINKERHKEPKVISLNNRLKKVVLPLAIAASLVFIFVINYNRTTSLDVVAETEIEEWIEDDLISLDSYEIAEVFNDVDLTENDTFDEDTELLDYLNGTDVESMILEN